jgi:dicarboxylate/amino acid:cation (Na+ or H+) symporter, DAACS family
MEPLPEATVASPRAVRPHHAMFIGVGAGIVLGVAADLLVDAGALGREHVQGAIDWVALPAGQIFLRLLFMLAVPLIFSALVTGVADLDPKTLRKMGGKTLLYTAVLSTIAVVLGLVLVNVLAPGRWDPDAMKLLAQSLGDPGIKPAERPGAVSLVTMIPTNPIGAAASGDTLGLIVFALVLGIGLAVVRTETSARLRQTIAGLNDVSMWLIQQVMRLAPFGVAALLFASFATLGVGMVGKLGAYVGTVVAALAIHTFVVYPLFLRAFAGMGMRRFFGATRLALTTAFATASSAATLPTTLRVAEGELGLPRPIARFVLTAGASMNQNGSALFEGITVLFLAQLFGVDLSIGEQLVVMLICILGGIGTAGIPGATLPVIAMMLDMNNVPAYGLALILGVDRILDMCRTTVNVAGDLVVASCVTGRRPPSRPPDDAPLDDAPAGPPTA